MTFKSYAKKEEQDDKTMTSMIQYRVI